MNKKFFGWLPTLSNHFLVWKRLQELRSAPNFVQKLEVSAPASFLCQRNQDYGVESSITSCEDHYSRYEYTRSDSTVASIQNRAIVLLHQLEMPETEEKQLNTIIDLVSHMKMYPVTRAILRRVGGIKILLKLREYSQNEQVKNCARAALVILGYADPVEGQGVCILSLDGGGTREVFSPVCISSVISIAILKQLEQLTGKRIYEMFDLIVGTSTGALLAFLIGINRIPLPEIMKYYRDLSSTVFQKSVIGTAKLVLSHALYDGERLVNILKAKFGVEKCMIDTAYDDRVPKVAAVSTLVNHEVLQPYIFRNYCVSPTLESNYYGSSKHKLWQALQATTAAPGYFEECKLGSDIHQDGGLLANNPCSLAIHESKRLWPDTPLQTVVSIGNGVFHGTSGPNTTSFTTLPEKLQKIVAAATDVEAVHNTLKDLLPSTTYFRFNPNLSAYVPMDECSSCVIDQLLTDAQNYIDKYDWKCQDAANSLMKRRTCLQSIKKNWM